MDERELKIILKLQDETSKELKKVSGELGKAEKQTVSWGKALAIGAAGLATLTVALGSTIQEAMKAEKTQARLKQIVQTSTGATDDQVKALIRQADALEKVGVVSADAIIQAQGQLASFDLQTESIEKLIPSMLNYAVAERGVGASAEDLQSVTNGLAQALQGNFASLTKVGFVLDDNTKALISNGTEAERVAALAGVLDSTYAGLNERLRETTEGRLFALNAQFGKLKESIGVALLPVINDLLEGALAVAEVMTGWDVMFQNIQSAISSFFADLDAKTGLITLLGEVWDNLVLVWEERLLPALAKLWEALKPLQPFLEAMGQVLGFTLVAAIAAFALALQAVIVVLAELISRGIEVVTFFTNTFAKAWDFITDKIALVIETVDKLIRAFERAISLAGQLGGGIGKSVNKAYESVLGAITGKATGGSVSGGTPYIVGERGAELFVPNTNGTIVPNHALGAGVGGGITVNVYGDVSGQELIDKVSEALGMDIKRRTRLAT